MRTRFSHLTTRGLEHHIVRAQSNLPKLTVSQQNHMRLVISELQDELARR
jgi:hypothetical protein